MPDDIMKIIGQVIDAQTGDGIEDVKVRALGIMRGQGEEGAGPPEELGKVATEADGNFSIPVKKSKLKSLDGGITQGKVYFEVYDKHDIRLREKSKEAVWRPSRPLQRAIVKVMRSGREQPEDPKKFTVSGLVRDAAGAPHKGVMVRAFDRDLRREEPLGEKKTDASGYYQISYSSDKFRRAEKESADLVVKAFSTDGALLVASPVLFNAPPVAEVDLTIPAEKLQPPTLFEKIGQALAPLLEGLKVEELEEDKEHQDLIFLVGEIGFEKHALARFVMAHKLGQQGIQPEFWFAVLGGSFFQFAEDQSLKEQMAAILDSLPSLDAAAVRKALTRSFNQKEIPEAFRGKVAAWVEAFLKFVASRSVSGSSAKQTFVKSALEHAGIQGAEKQEKFARLFNEHKALTLELLSALEKDRSFKKTEIADLRTSFGLAELTQGDFSVVKMLKDEFALRRPEQIRALAKRSEADWVDLVKAKHAAGDIKLPFEMGAIVGQVKLPEAALYGKMLERQFREAFPTTTFAGGLERAMANGGAKGFKRSDDIRRLLDQHEEFEFLRTPVDEFLKTKLRPEMAGLARDEQFKQELKAAQRVFKLAPTFEATDALLADGLHSAQQVYRLGESRFVQRYGGRAGFSPAMAHLAWNRAADTHAAVLTVVADLKALEAESLPAALQSGSQAVSSFPNWNNLFQTGDLCECQHCRSVLSPAAYFADLLMFLKDRESRKPRPGGAGYYSVKDILFHRRPDLGFLELNCDNALTPLPYVDVVCEVLENVVAAGENDLELAGFTAMPAGAAAAKAAVATALQNALENPVNDNKEKIELGGDFSLSQVDPSNTDRWVVHGDNVTYLLTKKAPAPNFFAEILRNTKASAAELRAYPQYVNPKTYEKLRASRYPLALPLDLFAEGDARRLEQRARSFALPFDLFAEEARTAFQKCNLQRWDLMHTLRGAAAPNNPTDGEIAAEYFGISADSAAAFDEKRLILVADATVDHQQVVWGETDNAVWLDAVGNVKTFLQKTGLEYNELLTLLDLKFVNPAADIVIEHLDASCDTDKKAIQNLDVAKLDRIHRFLRFWRKLKGWKMWELDLVVRHPRVGNGALDEPFLIRLFYFSRVRNRLGGKATVEQVCALFGDLNIETRFTKLHEKREDGLYQGLFLNRRLINPLNPAFQLDPATGDLPAGETISANPPVILAALGIREADLILLKGLTKASDGTSYINDDLTLANLSFLWRHSWLSKLLKFKVEEWKILLKIFRQDILQFSDPQTAWEFVEGIDYLKAAGFTPDELNWLLTADRTAKAATKEADAARFLAALRKDLQAIQAEYDPDQIDFLTVAPPADQASLTTLLASLIQKLNRDEAEVSFFLAVLRGRVELEAGVQGLPPGFTFPNNITAAPNHIPIQYEQADNLIRFTGMMTDVQHATLLADASLPAIVRDNSAYQLAIEALFRQSQAAATNYASTAIEITIPGGVTLPDDRPSIPIHYNDTRGELSFIGLMTDAERLALIAAGNPTAAIDELFRRPRLAVKFYELVFTTALPKLPPAVDFRTQLPAELAEKIAYDVEQRLLRFSGIMNGAERALLLHLSADPTYAAAVNSLATQPQTIAPPDERIWLTEADLDATQPANDTYAKRLAKAARKALAYMSKTVAEGVVIQQSSAQLELPESLTRCLLTDYALLPETLQTHLTGPFAATGGVVEYTNLRVTFDGWFWAQRVAAIWKRRKIALADLERIVALTAGAQLLDFLTLPLDDTKPIAPIDRFLRTNRLLRLRDSLPETQTTLLEVLEKLNSGTYAAASDFAADVQRLNEAWLAADVDALILSLDLAYPAGYLLAESWERLRRAFYFLDNLNGGANTVKELAAATMGDAHRRTIKELLRSKFGTETWLSLSSEIQDALRERKRDALAAYLLTRPKPNDAPSGKWENTNDLYAYYLLDVEMGACQLTSRLVQASGSVQLFVQRCFMGLEPDVEVKADGVDGDSAWRWWKWMRKYRVWEANRKVFLWPENWIEPELKKDRSQFFKDLENELLQNEINQYTVDTALLNYLGKLDGVAQLEIAGSYQEDDGDNTIVHVFGRTAGAEPHIYYYRRYDYRQWTPWEKVDLDIQGDYLIPAVVNKRLYLFWPVFTEVPDESGNSTVRIPSTSQTTFSPDKTKKKLRLQMAVSEYRQGKWTPKRISKDFADGRTYDTEIVTKFYQFFAIDRSEIDGRFGIHYFDLSSLSHVFEFQGGFEISSCKGVPRRVSQKINPFRDFMYATFPEGASTGRPEFSKWVELDSRHDAPQDDLTLLNIFSSSFKTVPVLLLTPGIFRMTFSWHLSYFDKLFVNGLLVRGVNGGSMGTWLPFFYNDKKRTFFVPLSTVLPPWTENGNGVRSYYPEIKNFFRQWEGTLEGAVQTEVDNFDLSVLTNAQRQSLEEELSQQFPEESPPPYTNEQFRDLLKRVGMRFQKGFLGNYSFSLSAQLHFKNYYHPFVCDFAKLIYNPLKGIPALMSRETQFKNTGFSFRRTYQPAPAVVEQPTDPREADAYPKEVVDFSPDGAYSHYNWELFFHAPLMIANQLSRNQRFEEARDCYHFIFNPLGVESRITGGSPMSKYWITKPFFETTDPQYVQQRIDNILRLLAGDTSAPGYSTQARTDLENQVVDWRTNPFEPHRIANYRTVAYQKTVVMKYLDNLIAWGDNLFRQDSMESINEATQLYILAAEILGSRPRRIPPRAKPPVESFNELEQRFDEFSNALVEVENLVPQLPGNDGNGGDAAPLPMLYFCVPQNDKMLGYWDTVADRLYKIRHCMNIEGVVRQLALFEPPIDPGALVKAVAAGVDISSALADLNAPLPLYRFNVLLQKANEVCNDVKALGGALLAALEKKDAEALGLLRQSQEIRLLQGVKVVREEQIAEAKDTLESLRRTKSTVEERRDFYRKIEKISGWESASTLTHGLAVRSEIAATVLSATAGTAHLIPKTTIGASGFGGSPHVTVEYGGENIGKSAFNWSAFFGGLGGVLHSGANLMATQASYERRWEEWRLQERLADKELLQIDRQIAAAELRVVIAEKELDNHVIQIENAEAIDSFMRSKYTNQELYQWQMGQISGVYFQSYRLAYDLAKRAERCFRFELGLQDSSYINFGYWDSLKKGLLSGEKLQYDLRRLESAYVEQNRREFELTKHVSLALLDPLALVKLRETGRCFFRLPEEIFDLDYPGHYFRRIKSVSLTLPCVVGPYTTISCTLRLLKNGIRINTANGDNGYPRNTDDQGMPTDDPRFIENNIPVKAIAASTAQNDSGVFELSFRDERYLPFEGAGVASEWLLELFSDPANPDFGKPLRQFDHKTISDAILHVKYMAREDSGAFKNGAIAHLRDYLSEDGATHSVRMFNLRQEFPTRWHRFLHPANAADGNLFELEMASSLFSVRDAGKTLKVNTIWLLARCTDPGNYEVTMTPPLPAPPPVGSNKMTLGSVNEYGGLRFSQKDIAALGIEVVPTDPSVTWQVKMTRPGGGNLQVAEVEDVFLVLGYEWE